MSGKSKKFKSPPKKYQPKGLSIIYEDRDVLVVDKESGLLTVGSETEREKTAFFLLNNWVKKGNPKAHSRIFVVHRLDKDTSGILLFAKSEKAKYFLQDNWQKFQKKYYAVVKGLLPEKEGVLSSYLMESSVHKMYSVDDPKKGKLAKTGYRVLKQSKKQTLVEVDLMTGRKNQIRVQFAEEGYPVSGDKKYGKDEKGNIKLKLHAFSLTFIHPFSKEEMSFDVAVPDYFDLKPDK